MSKEGISWKIVAEKMPLDLGNFNIPSLSIYLFNLAKEMKRGLVTIENVQSKLVEQIDKLKQQKNKKQLSTVKVLSEQRMV